ncbi:hypothetical protein LTR36_009894 [Oleoguttula mirabilis]|uniref:Uncharacterized protein n=1 Tax=Oleoguttula mirabilis TaxID=1507867 RepID=A0AAV9J5S8_9PEZI|nr:hypothetical protein LTR36_009894 [Oleoguttula mirabilis]
MDMSPTTTAIFAFGTTVFVNGLVAVLCFFAAMVVTYISSSVSDWLHKVDDEEGKWTFGTSVACFHTAAALLLRWPGCHYLAAVIVGYFFFILVLALFGILPPDGSTTPPSPTDTTAQRGRRGRSLTPPRRTLSARTNRRKPLGEISSLDSDADEQDYNPYLNRLGGLDGEYDEAGSLGEDWDRVDRIDRGIAPRHRRR